MAQHIKKKYNKMDRIYLPTKQTRAATTVGADSLKQGRG